MLTSLAGTKEELNLYSAQRSIQILSGTHSPGEYETDTAGILIGNELALGEAIKMEYSNKEQLKEIGSIDFHPF